MTSAKPQSATRDHIIWGHYYTIYHLFGSLQWHHMSPRAPQISVNYTGCSTDCSGKHNRKMDTPHHCKTAVTPLLTHWSYCSLAPKAVCGGICRSPVDYTRGQKYGNRFHVMLLSCLHCFTCMIYGMNHDAAAEGARLSLSIYFEDFPSVNRTFAEEYISFSIYF